VGYMYRTAFEYTPDDKTDDEIKELKKVINAFLDRTFKFNPDRHLRTSHLEKNKDPRVNKEELIKKAVETSESAKVAEENIKNKPEQHYEFLKSTLELVFQNVKSSMLEINKVIEIVGELGLDDVQAILLKKYTSLNTTHDLLKKIIDPITKAESLDVYKSNVPVDVFYNFDRYITNHYEDITDTCNALYVEKPDIEYSITYYDHFQNAEDAREHRIKNQKEFKSEIITIDNEGVCFLGPFKENRSALDIYNKDTEILKQMMDQAEQDAKLGKDLMKKKVATKKTESIRKVGPDSSKLKEYTVLNTSNLEHIVDKDAIKKATEEFNKKQKETSEKTDIIIPIKSKTIDNQAQTDDKDLPKLDLQPVLVDSYIPKDTVQTDVYHTDFDEENNATFKKTTFFTKAEAQQPIKKDK
jgi:hypothetical protein